MITKLNSNELANHGTAIIRYGSSKLFASNVFDTEFRDYDVDEHNDQFDGHYGEWSAGTGIIIDSTGVTAFDSNTYGGCLTPLVISNNGNQTLHYSINNDNPSFGSGTFPLATGLAIILDSVAVTKLWCITEAGTTVLNAHGPYKAL